MSCGHNSSFRKETKKKKKKKKKNEDYLLRLSNVVLELQIDLY